MIFCVKHEAPEGLKFNLLHTAAGVITSGTKGKV